MLSIQKGTLFFTGATASLRAKPPFTGFAAAKAGLRALAQGTEHTMQAALISYFAGGFALLFCAVFAFSYTIKSILNSKSQQWTNKQILKSSLRWALIIALILVVGIYLILR
jgi:NADH:ubiquinone oxidoreductase subunit 5 (subunit L)/multisubunit Na+/H+ antiporter MnhA subunit